MDVLSILDPILVDVLGLDDAAAESVHAVAAAVLGWFGVRKAATKVKAKRTPPEPASDPAPVPVVDVSAAWKDTMHGLALQTAALRRTCEQQAEQITALETAVTALDARIAGAE
ncbi:MAG: hypothetical protein OXC29_13480, partial [Rhodococcus sp.]|nr:hypothetical protein [Rhodococcus sp. (in: high G+C Gram-positive bacteria)]